VFLTQRIKPLSKCAIRQLIAFASTQLCETGLWNYAATKTKYRNRLLAAPDLRIQLSNIKPSIKRICDEKKENHSSQ
jgi:hypothetical protein